MVASRAGIRGAATLVGLTMLVGCSEAQEPADDGYVAPLDPYLREIWGGWDPTAPDPARTLAEESIADCMAEAGFEYSPVTDIRVITTPDGPGTLEYARQWGYGYSIEFHEGEGTLNWPKPFEESAAELANLAYVESLSPDAQVEYQRALFGDAADPLADMETSDWENGDLGCNGRAYEEAYVAQTTPELSEVREAVDLVWLQVEEDPRVIDARRAWGGCMAEAGYPGLTGFEDAENLVSELMTQFMISNGDRIDFVEGEAEYDSIKASVPAALAELQADEIAVAVADATCREDTGYNRTNREVTDEYQQAVVDMYRTELEAWVEAARELKASQ